MADKNYILKFTMSDGSEKTVQFSVPQGENGKTAYQYAQEAGYTGTEEEFAEKLAAEKADAEHTHAVADVSGLQAALDKKSNSGHNHTAAAITQGTLNIARIPTVTVAKGGTGATTAEAARTNLGVYSTDEVDSKIDGCVKTVNGISPDANGNVNVNVSGGGSTPEASLDVTLSADEMAELTSTIADLKALKKANTSVVAFLTDPHMAGWTVEKIKKSVYGYNKVSESVKTDLLLLGGDYLDNSPATTKEQALAWYSDLRDVLSYRNAKVPAAVIKGNHDDNTMYTDYANGLIDFETFWSALGDIDADETVRNAGNIEDCYGYYDIPNQKVRVFYVNTVDIPQEYIELTNSVTYKGQYDTGISVKQLQFIADNLKFDTPGWHVMVFSHHPLMRDIAIENGCGVQADRGGAALLELLDKFNSGNTAGSITVTATDFAGTVSYDFTANADCKIVACINGHTHRDSVDIYNESFFCISTRGVYGHPSYDGHISSSAYFVVDRNNEKLHLLYNGDGEENVFDYATLGTGEEEPSEPVYEEIASPFRFTINTVNDSTGAVIEDPQKMRIASQKVGFTTPAIIDMSAFDDVDSAFYQAYWYDTNGNYIGKYSTAWESMSKPITVSVDETVVIKIRYNNYASWEEFDKISILENSIKVHVEEGGESYIVGENDSDSGEIVSPFEWEIGQVDDTTGVLTSDTQSMRIHSTEIIGFTTPATIDMSAYSCMYVCYLYDTYGNYVGRGGDGWVSSDIPVTIPVDRTVRFKVRGNNYELWTDASISTFASAIKVHVEEGGEAYIPSTSAPDEPETELGKPLENVLYVIGGSVSTGTVGVDIYGNPPRMSALTTYGVKAFADTNNLASKDVYPIAIPTNATKVTIVCPDHIYGIGLLRYENDTYTRTVDAGWQTLGGGEYSFEAGVYSHIIINFKNSSNTTISADVDTSGFSIVFE